MPESTENKAMSSAAKQLSNRRLPPLSATGSSGNKSGGSHGRSTPPGGGGTSIPTLSDSISTEQVTSYLDENPDFLENYVLSNVKQDQLERWVIRGAHKITNHRETNGLDNEVSSGDKTNSLSNWKFCVHSDKKKMLQELTREIHRHPNKPQVLSELTNCVASAISADGFNLYLVDECGNDIYYFKPNSNNTKSSSVCTRKIGPGSTLAAYVAYTKQTVCVDDVLGDERFPEGIAVGGGIAKSVLAQPIIESSGSVVGVVELYRTIQGKSFAAEDEEIVSRYIVWATVAVYYAEMYHTMTKQRKLNDFLLAVTRSVFQDIVSMDTVIMKIMNFAKKLVQADRASLFLVDLKMNQLFARIFDTGQDSNDIHTAPSSPKEIRFPMDKGIAGHVASTGETTNILDAYKDDRFNRDVDRQTGYTTKTILCMPIYIRGCIIGVVQMVNKLNGVFTKSDEEAFETFAVYCGLALHHAKLYDKIRRSEQKNKVALEVLSYHARCSEEEVTECINMQTPEKIPGLTTFEFSPWSVEDTRKPVYVLYMFKDLFKTIRFDLEYLMRFTLTVRKNYRNVPYHNWIHAFSVAHSMYTLIKSTNNTFTPLESLSLFVACLCHDLDHRGKTNSFMVKSDTPLAAIYSTSTMEHHHFNQTVTILQHEGHNIFNHLTSQEYKEVLGNIKKFILATDLALFFGNKARLKELADKKEFVWNKEEHRSMLAAHCMTAADLCSMYKPWQLTEKLAKIIMEEFWLQGDEEKEQGIEPIAMMDRDKADQLPQSQVGFIVGICLPCYELLANILPETHPMVMGASSNLKKWKELAEKQGAEKETQSEA